MEGRKMVQIQVTAMRLQSVNNTLRMSVIEFTKVL
jgi:hypothetical protein